MPKTRVGRRWRPRVGRAVRVEDMDVRPNIRRKFWVEVVGGLCRAVRRLAWLGERQ